MTDRLLHFPAGVSSSSAAPARVSPEQIAEALSAGMCPADSAFDSFLPDEIRARSSQHWTPLEVAVRCAQWFDECNIRTVVDIGSGAGKFCVAAALAGQCSFIGLEHRERLVACARALARTFELDGRVEFIHGAVGEVSLPAADAYYLYNPFEENIWRAGRIDADVELSSERRARDLFALRALLAVARAGTYVLTYNGFGAKLPPAYRAVRTDRELPNVLCLWRKATSRNAHDDPSIDAAGSPGAA